MKLFGDLKRTRTVGKELNAISDTQEKELFALDRSIERKYAKEIASPEELQRKKALKGLQERFTDCTGKSK